MPEHPDALLPTSPILFKAVVAFYLPAAMRRCKAQAAPPGVVLLLRGDHQCVYWFPRGTNRFRWNKSWFNMPGSDVKYTRWSGTCQAVGGCTVMNVSLVTTEFTTLCCMSHGQLHYKYTITPIIVTHGDMMFCISWQQVGSSRREQLRC